MTNNYLNLTDSAEMLGISRMTIHRWIKKGKITPIIIGDYPLFTPEQLRPYIVNKTCTNCYHNSNAHCNCREACDIEQGCKDWVWKCN